MEEQVNLGVINLNSSIALVVIAGNDYYFYQNEGGTMKVLNIANNYSHLLLDLI